jgi:uncharacterized protein (TIRG00374 family)
LSDEIKSDVTDNNIPESGKGKVSFKWLILSTLIGLIIVIVFLFIGDFRANLKALRDFDPKWLAMAAVCLIMFWLSESATIFLTARISGVKLSFLHALDVNMMGQFYNSVTPFATGGQPMQIYRLYQYGISPSKGTAITMSRFLIYQSSITVLGVFLISFFFRKMSSLPSFSSLAVIGFIVNSAVIFFVLIFSFSPKLTRKIFDFILWLVSRFKFGKKMKAAEETWLEKIEEFHTAMKLLTASPFKLILAFLATSVQIFFFYSISYCIYRMFEAPVIPFTEVFAFQGILFMITSFVPVPGASGAAEGGFYLFFKNFFSPSTLAGAVIMWRIMTYYMNIFIGAPFALKNPKKKKYDIM